MPNSSPSRRRRTAAAIPLAAFAVLAAACVERSVPPVAVPPNILFLLTDDLGYEDIGVYGGTAVPTPHIDSLAAEGMRFTQFYTNGAVCSPTRAALLTGRYPQRFGIREGLKSATSRGIAGAVETLPGLLRQAGYETMHVGKWHLGHARPEFRPLGKGYDGFFGFLHAWFLPRTYLDPELQRDEEPPHKHSGHLEDLLTDEVIAFLHRRQASDPPFFLSYWTFSPHAPYEPPPRWGERYDPSWGGRYKALLSTLDENVGRLLTALEETGLAENTLVVFASDNGGIGNIVLQHEEGGPFRGAKNFFEEGGIRVPLIVRWPGRVAAGAVRDDLVMSHDWLPTLAEIAGTAPSQEVDGRSIASLLRGEEAPPFEGPLFWEDYQGTAYRFAVRQGPWKLLVTEGQSSLFDLAADPGERHDLAAQRPEVVRELTDAYRKWRRDTSEIAYDVRGSGGLVGRLEPLDPGDGEFTFTASVCPGEPSAPGVIARKGEGWSLVLTEDRRLRFAAGGNVLESRDALLESRCSQVAFTFFHMGLHQNETASGHLRLYVDAELVAETTTSGPLPVNDDDVELGRNVKPRFWNTALTAAELRDLVLP